ncbi:MAG: PspC domain-containing protein, partial [Armatimonadetes bacterium]
MTATTQGRQFAWPFHRSVDDRLLAGVAGGIAERLGYRSIYVRAAFICATMAGGVGLVLYVLAALIVPEDASSEPHSQEQVTVPQTVGLG